MHRLRDNGRPEETILQIPIQGQGPMQAMLSEVEEEQIQAEEEGGIALREMRESRREIEGQWQEAEQDSRHVCQLLC